MTTWISDENGNKASVECWGSEEKAREALESCNNCINCNNCNNCNQCNDCIDCINCNNCNYCNCCNRCDNCNYCKECAVKFSTRSDGYTFYLDTANYIRAGCRMFHSFAEAREHWKHRKGTQLGIETEAILQAMEQIVELMGIRLPVGVTDR